MEGGLVEVIDAEGEVEKIPPCFDFLTEGDLLNDAGIPWAYYGATNRQYGYIFTAYSSIRRYREHPGAVGEAHPARRSGRRGHRGAGCCRR